MNNLYDFIDIAPGLSLNLDQLGYGGSGQQLSYAPDVSNLLASYMRPASQGGASPLSINQAQQIMEQLAGIARQRLAEPERGRSWDEVALDVAAGIGAANRPGASLGQALSGGAANLAQQNRISRQEQRLREAAARQEAMQTFGVAQSLQKQDERNAWIKAMTGEGVPGGQGGPQPSAAVMDIPPDIKRMAGVLGPEKGAKFIADFLAKRAESGQFQDEERNGVKGQINKLTGQWTPYDKSLVNVNLGGPNAFESKYGEVQAGIAGDMMKAAGKAGTTIAQLSQFRDMMKLAQEADLGDTGALAPLKLRLTRFLQGLGLKPDALGLPANAGPMETIKALGDKLGLANIGAEQGGIPANNFTEADRELALGMAPQLQKTAAGNSILIDLAIAGHKRNIQQAQEWRKWTRDPTKGKDIQERWDNFSTYWDKWVNDHPIVDDAMKARIEQAVAGVGSPAWQPAPQGKETSPAAAPGTVKQPGEIGADPRAAEIKKRYQAGEISRDEAARQLRALGYQ